jgi:arylsulfatase A-like enzyme
LAAWLVSGLILAGCSSKPPNVLLISLDTTRADHLSTYGYSRETSPFLTELASRGVLFRNAYVNTHGTVPSHTTILSSEYAESHRALGFDQPGWSRAIPETVVLLQQFLKRQGYVTIGVTDGGWMTGRLGFARGFDYFKETRGVVPGTARLLETIEALVKESPPIFAFLHTYQVHSPDAPPPKYRELFGQYSSTFEPTSENLIEVSKGGVRLSETDRKYVEAMYDAEIRFTDDTLRAFWGRLEESGFLDHFIVVVTSDHGEEFGEHGAMLHGPRLYDELLHVPLIVAGSRVPRGVVDDRLASSVDIVPTIVGTLGLDRAPRWAGSNLLEPSAIPPEEQVVFSQYGDALYSVRMKEWKLIVRQGTRLLFDLTLDPGEHNDVAAARQDVVQYLERRLTDWRRRQPPPHLSTGGTPLMPEQKERLRSLGYLQ